ncbi:hypothetical protein [Homoserinibacter gongjuensis]|uniref:Uncharacterized protein n=1 Tax=Homoserinibacter gongjuensis TaxID=1162968 RepID=A0ABQ6JS41_9MICO|nr:hypothetical protein [Homoserinibacter gongjuensis]GMA91122.1 hypothetical protein GCM10025869_16510 [Homoserinibacter gongjuensis]
MLAGGRWALSDASEGLLWIEGLPAPVQTGRGADARLQAGASADPRVLLADSDALVAVATGDGSVTTLAEGAGNPAAPIVVGGVAYAAWLSTAGGRSGRARRMRPSPSPSTVTSSTTRARSSRSSAATATGPCSWRTPPA